MVIKLLQSIMVTGGSGFIGMNLVRSLRSQGYNVNVSVRKSNLSVEDSLYQVGDINKNTNWLPALKNVSCVIHTAGKSHAGRVDGKNLPDDLMPINCDSTVNLAQQAAEAGVQKFIFLSSLHVNGLSCLRDAPIRYDSPVHLVDPYGRSKYAAEIALKEISAHSGMELVIIRPPLVYGPGVKGNFARLIKLAGCGIPLPLGGIDNRRSYVGIDNLMDLIMYCINSPNAAGETFLVSDGHDISTSNLIKIIANTRGKKCRVFSVPEKTLFQCSKILGITDQLDKLTKSLYVDIGPTIERLKWHPPYTLEEGLQKIFR